MSALTKSGRSAVDVKLRRVAALTAGAVLVSLCTVLGPGLAPQDLDMTSPAAAAPGDACLDELGDPTPCEFGLEPVTLPVGQTIGEYELGLLSRVPGSQEPQLRPRDFAAGDFLGGCVPDQEACLLDNRVRVGARDPDQSPDDYFLYENATPVSPSTNSGVPRAAVSGDMAVERADTNGDGREELIYAAECESFTGPSAEVCLSLYDPAVNEYTPWQRTGLDLGPGFAPIRLAAGSIAQSTATVVGAAFDPAPDGNGMFVTMTTAAPHELRKGQAVRFDLNEAFLLNESLCVTNEDGETSCAGAFGEQLQAVEAVSADRRTFTVRVGSMVNATPAGDCPEGFTCLPDSTLLPNDWPAEGCTEGCSVRVMGTGPGLAVAFAAPGSAVQVAALTVRSSATTPFQLGDVANVGVLSGSRKALSIAVGDLDGGLPDEIAVAHATTCSGSPCSQVRLFRWNDSSQLVSLRTQRLPDITDTGPASLVATTESIDLAVGHAADAGNTDGADLVVGTVRSRAATVVQELAVLDVSPDYGVGLVDGQLLRASSGASQALDVQRHAHIRVAADDVDGDGLDDPVVAATVPVDLDFDETQAAVQLDVFGSSGGHDSLPDVATAIGPSWSGQIDLAVGQIGRVLDPADVGMPNAINPDIVVSWACSSPATCGDATSGTGVATRAFGVDADGPDLQISAPGQSAPVFTAAYTGELDYSEASEKTYVAVALADLDADSETLGAPVSYLTVGQVQPMLVLKSPPVHFDVFDGGSDGKVDGLISYNDTDDVSGCFALNKPDDCGTSSNYTTVTAIDTSVSGSVSNSWGISGSVAANAWFGSQTKDPDTDEVFCQDPVCGALSLKVKVEYEGQQEDEAKAGKTFTYSASRSVGAGADSAFAVVQTTETLEWPVYPGVSSFGANLEPGRYVRVDSPAETRFQWIDAHDPELSARWWTSTVPTNVLSYPRTAADIPADSRGVSEVEKQGTQLRIHTRGNHGWVCELDGFTVPDGPRDLQPPGYLTKYPCASSTVPVSVTGLTGPGAKFNGNYLVTEVLGADDLLVSRVGGDVPAGSWKAGDMKDTNCSGCPLGSLRRTPGAFLDQDIAVVRGAGFDNSVEVKDETEFKASASWSIDTSLELEAALSGSLFGKAGTGVTVNVGGHYKRAEAASRTVQATSGTTFAIKIGANPKSGDGFFVRPFLAADPVTKAMVLDWTTDCRTNCTGGIWGDVYRRSVDLGFALPQLLTPFRDPNNTPYDLGNLTRSPDFQTWDCTLDPDLGQSVCEPLAAAETGEPLTLTAFMHNYSLKPFTSQKPATIRYFVGDPLRGGYLVTEAKQNRVAAGAHLVCSGVAFCIPERGEALVRGRWTPYPGLAGRGSPDTPLAIYGIIKPPSGTTEIHPWEPVDLPACKATYPLLDALHSEYYDPTSVYDDRLSRCPTTNNQGHFVQQFAGTPARASDLSINASAMDVSKDGASLKLGIRASRALAGHRVAIRLWSCARTAACSTATLPMPSNASPAQGLAVTKRLTIPTGGTQTVRLPLGLPAGTRKLTVQLVPIDVWERPGGPGAGNPGQLRNNVVTTLLKVP